MCTEVSCSFIEVGTVAVATDLDASSVLCIICIDLLQQNLDLLTIPLWLVVLLKDVKCVFKTICVSHKGESGLIIVKGLMGCPQPLRA